MAAIDDAIAALERRAAAAQAEGAAAAADAMAAHFIDHERRVTLTQSGTHGTGDVAAQAPRGAPPARVTGWLGDSFRMVRAAPGGMTAAALAGPTAIYSRVQEMGARITKSPGLMHWSDSLGPQWRHVVRVGPHPYMRLGVDQCIADGSLRDHAAEAFAAVVRAA
jgi:hypothetical protein